MNRKEIPVDVVLVWMDRYGSLIDWLEKHNGYGTYVVQMHGRRPVKVGQIGRMETLDVTDFRILASEAKST